MRYLLTFACYGAHLHGDEWGSVDRGHKLFGARRLAADASRLSTEWNLLTHAPYVQDARRRDVVLAAIREVCEHAGWGLIAAHVRMNHVHAVVESEVHPDKVMNTLRSYASRSLNRIEVSRKLWARHGSRVWLWKDQNVRDAVRYVVDGQGEPMSVFLMEGW